MSVGSVETLFILIFKPVRTQPKTQALMSSGMFAINMKKMTLTDVIFKRGGASLYSKLRTWGDKALHFFH